MRAAYLYLCLAAACTSSPPAGGPLFDSVRDRMQTEPTRFYIGPEAGAGAITASHYTHDGWVGGTAPIAIENGELVARVEASGKVALDAFDVHLAPIDIPESVFGKPAQIKNVRLMLANRPVAAATWTSEDEAASTIPVALDLQWAISVDGGGAPLGTQHLPAFPVDLTLAGTGDHVDATLGLQATGDLWSWAGLVKVTGLELDLSAASLDP